MGRLRWGRGPGRCGETNEEAVVSNRRRVELACDRDSDDWADATPLSPERGGDGNGWRGGLRVVAAGRAGGGDGPVARGEMT